MRKRCNWYLVLLVIMVNFLVIAATACNRQTPASSSPTTPSPSPTPPGQTVPSSSPPVQSPSPTPALSPSPALTTPPSVTTPTPAATTKPVPLPKGTVDPDLFVDIYQPDKVWGSTTLLSDNHDLTRPRIIEVNMLGEIVWQYLVPENLKQYTNPGFDVELLPNNNILFVLPRRGVYEIDRSGNFVWSYLHEKISHDADRLPNGNTIFVFGAFDQINDAQVKEVNTKGEIVWAWYAKDHFNKSPFTDVNREGWTHTNAVSRLPNGNTLISLRNFNFVVEVNPQGAVVRTIGEGSLRNQHDPVILPDGNVLLADHNEPQRAIEIDPEGQTVWQFILPRQLVRDADRLPNGNTLITGSTKIVEVSSKGEIVWQFGLKLVLEKEEAPARGFYKAQRINLNK